MEKNVKGKVASQTQPVRLPVDVRTMNPRPPAAMNLVATDDMDTHGP